MFPVAACGGGSDKKASSTTTAPKPAASSSTTTTFLARPAADAALAKKSVVTLADLGSQWTEYKAATGPGGSSNETACGIPAGGPTSKVGFGAVYGGPQAKFTPSESYAISTATVFPDEATAKAWVDIRKTPAYKACRTQGTNGREDPGPEAEGRPARHQGPERRNQRLRGLRALSGAGPRQGRQARPGQVLQRRGVP